MLRELMVWPGFINDIFISTGCELSSKVPFYTFQVDEEEGEEEENVEHFLELRTVCLCFAGSVLAHLDPLTAGCMADCCSI